MFGAVVILLCLPVASHGQVPERPAVVIVHGAFGGGWDWRTVERELRDRGRDVFRVTLTGLGERNHLASPEIGLDTHVADVVNVIVWEQLEDVVLVGHSYGGMVITGVVERLAERIGHLAYVDAMLPFDGDCAASAPRGPDTRRTLCNSSAAGDLQVVDGLVVPPWVREGTPPPMDVPHPLKTLRDPLELQADPGRGRPATYILTRAAPDQADGFDWAAARATSLGWPVREIISGHNPQRDAPSELAELLMSLD